MKGVSVIFTILLFVVAVRLAVGLQRRGASPEAQPEGSETLVNVPSPDNSFIFATHTLQAMPYLN